MINKFLNGGGQNRSLYQQMSDEWQKSYNNYLNGLDKSELPAGLHYNENGEAVMPPDEVIKRGYTFLTDNTGKVKLLDKDNKIIFDDVLNQPNLHDWIDKNKLWNKPKSLSEASQVASIRNPEGMKTIRDAFQWGGNWAGGTIAAPVLAVGASEFAPYLYSKAPQIVDKAMRFMNPGSVGEMALGKDAATQAIKTGIQAAEKYPWLMANTWQGATANGLWMAGGSAAALNEAKLAFSGESTDSKAAAALNAGLAIPFMPIRGVENAEALLKLPFLRNKEGNLNLLGLYLNRGPWKQTKTLWRQFHKKDLAPYTKSDINEYSDNQIANLDSRIKTIDEYFENKKRKLTDQRKVISENLNNIQNWKAAIFPRIRLDDEGNVSKVFNFSNNYWIVDPNESRIYTSGTSTYLTIPENNPKYQILNYHDVYLPTLQDIITQTPSTPEEIANFKTYRQSINDLLKEDGLVAGSTVGYSRGYIQGGMNNDTEIITTRSRLADAQKKMKFTKVGENSIGGDVGTSPLAKGKTPQVEYDIIDEDASGNATGTLAHQIFQALHPEEARQFYKANIDNDTNSYTLSLPIKAELLLQELRQEGNMEKVQMLDMFGAGINMPYGSLNFIKQASRAYNVLLNPEFVPQVRSTLDLMGQKQFGPKFELFSSKISDFTNIEDNKRFLNEIINTSELKYFSPEQIEEIAKNPEQMRNIFDYYNFNNFVGNRGMKRFSPLTKKDMTPSELREGFNANVQFGGGSGSGVGLNMTSGAWKAGDGFGAINGTRLLKTTYDPNPQSIPDWITQYRRITDLSNFPRTLYTMKIGDPNEYARIETESRRLNLPVWRNITTAFGWGAYNGSYAGPLYYETNPDNVFILHGVFPENGGLFTPKFNTDTFDLRPRRITTTTHEDPSSYAAKHPFEYLRKKGFRIDNETYDYDKEINSIARRFSLDKVWQHLLKRQTLLKKQDANIFNQLYNLIPYKLYELQTSIKDKLLRRIENDWNTRYQHVNKFENLNNIRRPSQSELAFQLGKFGIFSALGGITAASPFIIYNNLKKQDAEYNMGRSAELYGQIIRDLNNLLYNDKLKYMYGINPDTMSDEQLFPYSRAFMYNLPKEFVNADIKEDLINNINRADLAESLNERDSYINKINLLIKSYGYQAEYDNSGNIKFTKIK